MEMTKEMQEMMERTMEQYYAAYWEKHATPEQEAKRIADGKTFKGAFQFAKSVAEHYNKNGDNCVAMPDDLAYWLLMEYMESVPEGTKYQTAEEIEAKQKADDERAKRKRELAEKKTKERAENALKKEASVRASVEAEKATANRIAQKFEQMSLF